MSSRVDLFKAKLKACHKTYDFRDQKSDLDEKEWKRKTLLELIDFVNSNKVVYQESIMIDILAMVHKNIFRTLGGLGSKHKTPTLDPDEEEPNLEESWPHLQIVYELFLRYVISNDMDTRLAKKHLEPNFIANMLELFNSDDPRERDYLKTILHRIYGKFMNLRTFVRKAIMNVFYKIIFEYEEHKGVAELLEILCAIVSGFALPLKEEHRTFFQNGLIPLHKAHSLPNFHQQLMNCLNQFLEKDSTLAEMVIRGLLKFWPITNSAKEVLFLNETEELLEYVQMDEFQKIQIPLFKRLCECISSSHFQVAERSLFLWNNETMTRFLSENKEELYPLIIRGLLKNSKSHWNAAVQGLTFNVLKMLMEMDSQLFEKVSRECQEDEEKRKITFDKNSKKWDVLEKRIAK